MAKRELFTIQWPLDGLNMGKAVELFDAIVEIWPTAEIKIVDDGYLVSEEVPDDE
jgi:hypothetical protein